MLEYQHYPLLTVILRDISTGKKVLLANRQPCHPDDTGPMDSGDWTFWHVQDLEYDEYSPRCFETDAHFTVRLAEEKREG